MANVDGVDKHILMSLFYNGRLSQRAIATKLKANPPSINYRFSKLESDKILLGYDLYVNPNSLGKYHAFIALSNTENIKEFYTAFRCLEEINLYQIIVSNESYLSELIERYKPLMSYIPRQDIKPLLSFDKRIIQTLVNNPRLDIHEISQKFKTSSRTIKRHLEFLQKNDIVKVIPRVNLDEAGLVMGIIFSRNGSQIGPVVSHYSFFNIDNEKDSLYIFVADNLSRAKQIISKARQIDPETKVMIVYEYEVNSALISELLL
ncbi:winged helix-turn-helix domain-containing protein [Sulfolobales archaeon HS-7]|nr:winged helix-turn-helix domain-containing protein [Sulfolobales archaeon HS-7]